MNYQRSVGADRLAQHYLAWPERCVSVGLVPLCMERRISVGSLLMAEE